MNHRTDSSATAVNVEPQFLLQSHHVLNKDTEDELHCWGYSDSRWRRMLFFLLVLLSVGLLLLVVHWRPQLECLLKRRRCSLYKAKYILIRTRFGVVSVVTVHVMTEPIEGPISFNAKLRDSENVGSYTEPSTTPTASSVDFSDDRTLLSSSWMSDSDGGLRYFDYQKTRYLWEQTKRSFRKLEDLSTGTACLDLYEKYKGLTGDQRASRSCLYGPNTMEIEVPSYWSLFIGEVLNPFYIFQIASIILWSFDSYYYYASCIFAISCLSIGISLRETRKQRVTLRNMVATQEGTMQVCTSAQEFVVKAEHELVPGDVIAIPPNGCVMTCDAVLTAGTCIVNESMLTGESVPVTKTPLPQQEDEEIYSPEIHKRHTLFSGTHIVQTRYYGQAKVLAVVVRTGYNTAKGDLVRAILFPKPLDFQFYRDAIRFILFLGGVASIGMTYSLTTYIINKEPWQRTILRVLDIVTVVVPPALPAAMTVGTVYAQNRLKRANIFCISPPRINFCGRINVFCFDKTGTLTEDGLDMWGVVPVEEHKFRHHVSDPSTLPRCPLLVGLASCHSLTIIDGELSGDPLDLIMFNAIKWHLEEPGTDTHKYDTIMPTVVKPYSSDTFLGEEEEFEALQREHPFEVGIIRQFTFSSSSQRMSVVTRVMGEDHMDIYCKGAPEKVASLCRPETVPEDFHSVLHSYSVQGFRVIALAYRPMDPKVTWHQVQRISREKVEKDLTFLGLLVLQNQLKPETAPVIRTLTQAQIRSVMVTGDMLQTAISVARNCGMVRRQDRVIIAHGHPPDKTNSARLTWEEAEKPNLSCSEDDTGSNEVDTDVENAPLLSETQRSLVTEVTESRTSKGQRYTSVSMEEHLSRKHLAINGKSFAVISKYFPELLPKICVEGTVFARMSPDQKCQLIEHLQKLDYMVGMCGDGANDCEALKAAHAGISLSEAEASVAAPFTSSVNNIECVVTAMREGRAALVTSFGCFKYMALYSFIQFVTVLILYTFLTNLADFEFLYIDLVITTSIAVLMGNTAAYHRLVKQKPPGSLVKASNLCSIIFQVTLVAGFQLAGFFYMQQQPFYNAPESNHTRELRTKVAKNAEETMTWESTVMFLLSSFMYISVAFTFSRGPPFRKPIYTNYLFLACLVLLFSFSTFLLLSPLDPLNTFFVMMPLQDTPFEFRIIILALVLGFFIVSNIVEWIAIDTRLLKCLYQGLGRLRKVPPTKYKEVQAEINAISWPPVNQVTFASSSPDTEDVSEVALEMESSSVH
ncbi:probable cation-transporting ATPase 13A3 [Aplysia californica]|uniref:Probable cation-transporting ATPase 13A3 n=1 Tax=Aplysia californica TaxID=6500 RepID=A0ABM1ACQ9_APLCA|nr:probable cation-transporting ATPase 13A3 [Aplysia californica]